MAEFPALPLWTDAYLSDCSHLSDAEHGRYLLLLMVMWRSPGCRVPDDDAWLARKFRRPVECIVTELRPLIGEFCHVTGGWISQRRLSKERAFLAKKSEKNKSNARLRWETRQDPRPDSALESKENDACERNASSHRFGNAPTPTPTLEERKKESASSSTESYPPRDSSPVAPTVSRQQLHAPAPDTRPMDRPQDPDEPTPVAIIRAFDAQIVAKWGAMQRRPWPAPVDHASARRMADEGTTFARAWEIFGDMFDRMIERGARPPATLRYCEDEVMRSLK